MIIVTRKYYQCYFIILACAAITVSGCGSSNESIVKNKDTISCSSNIPSRFAGATTSDTSFAQGSISEDGMVYIKGGGVFNGRIRQ